MPDRLATRLLAACAVASFGALAIGQVLQHQFGMAPCPWCVLQRLIFVLVGVAAAIGAWAIGARGGRIGAALAVDALATTGMAAALYQHFVASRAEACGLTVADRVIMALSLHEIMPSMFFADAPCSEANLPFLGVPFALWSFAAFATVGALAATALVVMLRGGRSGPGGR